MANLNIGQIRTRRPKIRTLDSDCKELKEKFETKTVDKFQALYCLSREYFVYNIHAPFLVQAHKENCMSFFVCEIDHKVSISGLYILRFK